MFFPVFWTANIPVTLLILSLLWQRLLDFVRRKHAHVRIARSNRRSIKRTAARYCRAIQCYSSVGVFACAQSASALSM